MSRALPVHEWKGLFPALITPYDQHGRVDEQALRTLVRHLLKRNVDGFYVGGSTGEGFLQTAEERKRVLEVAVDEIAGAVPVIAHVGTMDTKTAEELAAFAEQVGANAVSAVTPFYYKHALPELKQHYMDIANASELPLIVYHFPALTGVSVPVDFYAELSQHERIVGVKFTSKDLFEMERLMDECGRTFAVFNGHDECLLAAMAVGADAAIGSTYHMMPDTYRELMLAFRRGDLETARFKQAEANRVIAEMLKYDTIAFIREVLRLQGVDTGHSRRPMQRLDEDEARAVREFVASQPCLQV